MPRTRTWGSQQDYADVGQTLADLLCLPTPDEPVQSRRGYLSDRVVRGAARLVDELGCWAWWNEWRTENNPNWQTHGGRPGSVDRQVLILLVALVVSGEPPLASRVAEALHKRLHTPMRDLLDLPRAQWQLTDDAVYQSRIPPP